MPHDQRRIVCAAIRAADGSLVLGIRHYSEDMHTQIKRTIDGKKFYHRNGEDQGFVDQRGVYLNRADAFVVALNAGQIVRPDACIRSVDDLMKLTSEGLY